MQIAAGLHLAGKTRILAGILSKLAGNCTFLAGISFKLAGKGYFCWLLHFQQGRNLAFGR
ncbi:hypothetical protein KM915_08945 [Cytobacillus oceanisediminis]|jgi:hypothetical protein|uniref:hypothetical protein n=1 Tax=Cytobacillus TaxID=2675230 RepID=UPI0002DDC76F|nr:MULTISPECIES: hypothetical protein [Cytobacillus]MBU8730178.1 hypothetical protein [Cytobacillus oceanisediminis]MCM3242003.1 hypothetical protein [Cytobacillus oceanisediminis]